MDKRYDKLQELALARAARRSSGTGQAGASQRGAGEGRSTSQDLSLEAARDDSELLRRLAAATRAAAVSGHFDPLQLFDDGESKELRSSVLTRLARDCIMPVGSETRWLLSSERRSKILEESGTAAKDLLLGKLPEADPFGAALRETIMHGAAADLNAADRTEAIQALSAIKFAEDAGLSSPDPAPLAEKVAQSNFLADYHTLLSSSFYGRSRQVRRLQEFLRAAPSPPQAGGWSSLVLSGLGGAGKSSLLAHFLKQVAETSEATIAVLDFDRPGIDATEPHLLELEMTRQIGYQKPDLEDELGAARERVRQFRGTLSGESFTSFELESSHRELRGLLWEVRQLLEAHRLYDKPLLLVLDTLEEVTVGGLGGKLVYWLNDVQGAMEPIRLKVIFSGRLAGYYGGDDESLEELPPEIESIRPKKILLGELPYAAAARLLKEAGIKPTDVRTLLAEDLVPRRPLELRLLGRLFSRTKDVTPQEIVDDLRNGGPRAKQMFAALVYRRVLQRIDDEDVCTLANPGLVLRFINEEIVSTVLVPALELDMDAERVAKATEALGSYAWLAVKRADGTIWHRRDLRRSMLKAMMAQEPAQTQRINRFAVQYFRDKRDEASQCEYLYHSLMLAQSPEDAMRFPVDMVAALAKGFAADLHDLPLVSQVYVRYVQRLPIKSGDLKLLPSQYRDEAIDEAGRRLVAALEFGQASDLTRSAPLARFRGAVTTAVKPSRWVIEALFATVDWREMLSSVPRVRRPSRTLQELSDEFYPFELAVERRTHDGTASVLGERLDVDGIARSASAMPDGGGTYTARLAVALALIGRHIQPSHQVEELAARIVDADEQAKLSPGLGPRQLILVALGMVERPLKFRIRGSQLRLNGPWLVEFAAELMDRGESGAASMLRTTLSALTESLSEPMPSIGRLLTKIDADESQRGTGRMHFQFRRSEWTPAKAKQFLRGPVPELRDPLRYALVEISQHDEKMVAELVASALPKEFKETRPKPFRAALRNDPAKALLLPLELVDRTGGTGALLSLALEHFPTANKLRLVSDAYARLHEAINIVFDRFGK